MPATLTTTRYGPMLVPPYDIYLAQAMIRLGEYAPAEFETWRPYIGAGATVVDVGANIGCHTLPFAHAVGPSGRVIAVEPQFMLFAMLCGSLAMNGLQQARAHWCAMGADAGVVIVPPVDYTAQGNFGGLELSDQRKGESVPRVTLDALALDRLDFLKVDVEGMELDVLQGGAQTISRLRPVIAVEADREPKVPALLDWLVQREYRLWWHRPPLGPFWPNIVSINLLALPTGRAGLPDPQGDVQPVQ